MSEPAARAARAYFEAVGAEAPEPLVALFTEDATLEDPVGAPVLEGHAGVARFHKGVRRAWQRLAMTPTQVTARGGRVAAAWRAEGLTARGAELAFEGINLFEVAEDGRIRRVEAFWDFESVVAQM